MTNNTTNIDNPTTDKVRQTTTVRASILALSKAQESDKLARLFTQLSYRLAAALPEPFAPNTVYTVTVHTAPYPEDDNFVRYSAEATVGTTHN